MKVYAVQNAGVTLDCASRQIHGLTNASGAIKFAPRIAGWENTNGVVILNGGVELARVKGRSTDLDGVDGITGLGDFAHFGTNFLTNPAAQETDFDMGGNTGLGDFAFFAAEFLLTTPPSAYCP
jgi:hypothetical protein